MEYCFNYLIEKIDSAGFIQEPFKHINIKNFFTRQHFEEIISCPEVRLSAVESDEELFQALFDSGYKIVRFPGCITDKEKYIAWHNQEKHVEHHTACEGFGVTLRLFEPKSKIMDELKRFLGGEEFNECIARKFGYKLNDCDIDGGVQKYLDGYEISPHPDVRKKAATFMVNINPSSRSESMNHHTHYLKFKPEREYIKVFWEGNKTIDRCWVPWSWCESVYQQNQNNSIVLFSPSNNTIHAVKASYDHLENQRTQLYGNLWFHESQREGIFEWEDLDLSLSRFKNENENKKNSIADLAYFPVKKVVSKAKRMFAKNAEKKVDKNIGYKKY